METSTMIRQLRRTAKKHENDKLRTFDTNISQMCTDVANRLEEIEAEKQEICNNAIDEFVKRLYKIGEHREFDWEDIYKLADQLKGE